VHAETVELFSDPQLVLDGRRHPFDLHAVAQGRIEHLDGFELGWSLGVHRLNLSRRNDKAARRRLQAHVGVHMR
jgi:hypothetical protein